MPISEVLTATTPHLHIVWVIVCAVVAVVLVATNAAELVVTLFHEAGHALASLVFGHGFAGVNMHTDGSGVAHTNLTSTIGAIPTGAAGYLGPVLYGLAVAWAYDNNRTPLALGGLAVVAGAFAVMSLSLFAFAVSGALAGLTGWVLVGGGETVQALLVLLLAWVLLLGGAKDAVRTSISTDGDQGILQEMTGVPAVVWGLGMAAVSLWCLWVGGRLLLAV